jgi:hypothetical protein
MLLAHHGCCLPIDAWHRAEHHRCDRCAFALRIAAHAKHGAIDGARCSRALAELLRACIIVRDDDAQ